MDITTNVEERPRVKLSTALLVYTGTESSFVMQHEIISDATGESRIGPGVPVTRKFVSSLTESLGRKVELTFMPENVLACTTETIVWWEKPAVRPMFWSPSADREHLNGRLYPQPALLFVVDRNGLAIWALADEGRPTPSSKLFNAPYWNVSQNGSVCLGSARVPNQVSVNNLSAWRDCFFESAFSHQNATLRTTHEQGCDGLWLELKGAEVFPAEYLYPTQLTVGQLLYEKGRQ